MAMKQWTLGTITSLTLALLTSGCFVPTSAPKTPIDEFADMEHVAMTYDKFIGVTTYATAPFSFGLNMAVIYRTKLDDKGEPYPNGMNIYLYSISKHSYRFIEPIKHLCYIIIDGERQEPVTGLHAWNYKAYSGFHESLNFNVSYETFGKMATAKSIEMRIGGHEVPVDDRSIAYLARLYGATFKLAPRDGRFVPISDEEHKALLVPVTPTPEPDLVTIPLYTPVPNEAGTE